MARREWDRDQRELAALLDQTETGWTVLYGLGGRRFYAIATMRVAESLIIEARTAEELRALIRDAEPAVPPPPRPRPPAVPHRHRRGVSMSASTPDGLRTVCRELSRDPATAHGARGTVRDTFTAWGLPPDLTDDAVLVVGELVANAVVYGEPPIRLSLWGMPERVCVRVTDHGPGRPHRLDLGQDAVHGRGLAIVETLADQWGVVPAVGKVGKTVWAVWWLSRPGPDAGRTVGRAGLIPYSGVAEERSGPPGQPPR